MSLLSDARDEPITTLDSLPAATPLDERLRFETLLADLSATFVNLPADEIDTRIEWSLRRITEFLDIDRSSFGEYLAESRQFLVTHSYVRQGFPPCPLRTLDDHLPWFAERIGQGHVLGFFRLPEELPPEAVREREYVMQAGLKSNLTIPLRVCGAMVGAIGFGVFRHFRRWPPELIQRLRLVGEIFANAVARKQADQALRQRERLLQRSQEDLRQLALRLLQAQEEERRRVAREMHDDWTQRLAVLAIDAARVEQRLTNPEEAVRLVQAMREDLVRLSEDVHALSRQLHPSILDDLGLVDALRSECASIQQREGLSVTYQPEFLSPTLPGDVALCVYRVAQEALRNIARHAATGEAWMTLGTSDGDLVLRVQDRGVGIDPAVARPSAGLGLSSMAERVRLVHGEFTLESAPGQGTTVTVRVPLDRKDS